MMRSFCFGFYFAVLLCFSHVRAESGEGEEEEDDSSTAFLNSLNGLKEVYLHNFGSEIQNSRSVLVYPAAVMQEFMLEHARRMPEGSSARAKVLEVMPFDTGLPFALDLTNFTGPPLKELAIKTFYSDRTPKMSATMDDPYYFSYRAFMEWSKMKRLESASGESTTPFNPFITVAAIRISSIQSTGFQWIDYGIDFIVSQRQTIQVQALRKVDFYDYAEFTYPRLNQCTAAALRLKINDDSSIVFIIARNVTNDLCNSSENLLQLLADKDVETISFTPKRMFVSIPILHVSTIVWPQRKLIELGLLAPKPNRLQDSEEFDDHYESASLIFDPPVPEFAPIPSIHPLTPRFEVERPFLVTVLQKENSVPVLAGLIQNPTAGFECCSPTKPQSISLTIQNKGQRPKSQRPRGTRRQSITTSTVPSITMGARQNNKGSD
jgi:hypothetical protein